MDEMKYELQVELIHKDSLDRCDPKDKCVFTACVWAECEEDALETFFRNPMKYVPDAFDFPDDVVGIFVIGVEGKDVTRRWYNVRYDGYTSAFAESAEDAICLVKKRVTGCDNVRIGHR